MSSLGKLLDALWLLNGLRYVVQAKSTSGIGEWESIAAFNSDTVARAYAKRGVVATFFEYRVKDLEADE